MQSKPQLQFKFRYVRDGQARGLRAKSGTASADRLELDGEPIRYEDIHDTTCRDRRLVVALAPAAPLGAKAAKARQEERFLVLEVQKVDVQELERHIDRHSSEAAAERHRQQLVAAGDESLFRAVLCPHCGATIDLSGFNRTRYVHCRFCGSLLDKGERVVALGEGYQTCGECQMFGRVRGYTVFYFYFLLVVYGFSYGRRYLCDVCAVRQARRALLLNFVFLLGIPSSVYMWIKAVTGHEPELKELPKANALAQKGKYQQADPIYDRLLMRHAEHPGLLFNQSVGHLRGGQLQQAIDYLNRSLRSCSNYLPAMQTVHGMQQVAEHKVKAEAARSAN
jgi:hypothetical protein